MERFIRRVNQIDSNIIRNYYLNVIPAEAGIHRNFIVQFVIPGLALTFIESLNE